MYLLSFAAGETQMMIMQTHQKVAHTSRLANAEDSPGQIPTMCTQQQAHQGEQSTAGQ